MMSQEETNKKRTFSLTEDVDKALTRVSKYHGDKTRIVNEALIAYLGLEQE